MIDKSLVSLVRQEGSLIYSDDQGRENIKALSFLSITLFVGREGEDPIMCCWRMEGAQPNQPDIGAIANSLAVFYSREPGLKEAVDGLYTMLHKRGVVR
jgi:hypothetical protein